MLWQLPDESLRQSVPIQNVTTNIESLFEMFRRPRAWSRRVEYSQQRTLHEGLFDLICGQCQRGGDYLPTDLFEVNIDGMIGFAFSCAVPDATARSTPTRTVYRGRLEDGSCLTSARADSGLPTRRTKTLRQACSAPCPPPLFSPAENPPRRRRRHAAG